jgi:hypothetical protein
MTIGIIAHAGDLANMGGKQELVEKFKPSSYVIELGYGRDIGWDRSRPWNFEGLYRMQPKVPGQQIERALESTQKINSKSLIVRLIEFPLAEQGDYAMQASQVVNEHTNISLCSPIGYFGVKDSITYRIIGNLTQSVNLIPIIRLTADEGIMMQTVGALAALVKGAFPVAPCLQIVGGEQLTIQQVDLYCKRVLAASDKLYLWSIGTIAGNPMAEQVMEYMNSTYPVPEPEEYPEETPEPVVIPIIPIKKPGMREGIVAVDELSIRKDCSLSAKIIGSMHLGHRVTIKDIVWPNKDLSFVLMDNGYYAVQHWSGIDYIIIDDTTDNT